MKTVINIKATILILVMVCSLISCNKFYSNRKLIGRYYLQHNKFGKSICYRVDDDGNCVELVNGAFGKIGFDDNYIIVERSKNEYLIIIIYKQINYFPEKGILGPFNLKDFNKQKTTLNIKADFNIDTN
ncbi:hypothetical protein [Mucilaginibacter sp.]|uniref:hypothetical protein n=1 Tax=Mucilaginibacter sp. TaxID=1882438 RepID=UPI003D0F5233